MSYTVTVVESAEREYRRLAPEVQRRVASVLQRLADDPRPSGVRKLVQGGGLAAASG